MPLEFARIAQTQVRQPASANGTSNGTAHDSTPRRALLVALAASTLSTTLGACAPLVVGGIAGGLVVLTDRRTLGAQTEDQSIELKTEGQIGEQIRDSGGISAVSFNRRVLLYGQAPDADAKRRAEQIAARIENVVLVHNELQVGARAGSMSAASDFAISMKVKAAFVGARELQANAIKVVTEAGTVYLMGIATRTEGDRAARVASGVSGVNKVVTLFEVVTEADLARIVGAGATRRVDQ